MIKKNKGVICFILAIAIFLSAFIIGYYNFYASNLKDFEVLDVVESEVGTIVYFEPNRFATKYEVIVTDANDKVIYETTVSENSVAIDEAPVKYGETINVKVIAYNRKEEIKESSNNLEVIWTEPSFTTNNSLYVTDLEDYVLNIEGEHEKAVYYLQVRYEDHIVYKTKIVKDKIVVPYKVIENYSGRLTAEIVKRDNIVVSSYNFFINTNVIGFVDIKKPVNKNVYEWDDIEFAYDGGEGANHFLLYIYEGEEMVYQAELFEKEKILPTSVFKEDTEYRFELVATYKDYIEISKKDEVTIKTGIKQQVGVVYATNDYLNIVPNTKLYLTSKTKDSDILYTTDGSDPLINGIKYEDGILIEKDVVITAIGTKKNMYNSISNILNVSVNEKKPVVYLSPSNQYLNFGAARTGYTHEREMMNKVADVIEPLLIEAGIIVYRNNPNGNIKSWTAESRSVKADLHLAIHSNASGSSSYGQNQGMEIFVHDEESYGFSIANLIHNNLYEIYPYKSEINNRGVKYARGKMGEVHPLNVKVGLLMEMAFHDNVDDALWIVNNIEPIGRNIAKSIISYFELRL